MHYIFFELVTGSYFQVEAMNGEMPYDKAAGMLAMHCMVRGLSPADYTVLAKVGDFNAIKSEADELLKVGHLIPEPIHLTAREDAVLRDVVCGYYNKEIGQHLNICERTVKFHVSALLAKFGVKRRNQLTQDIANRAVHRPTPAQPDGVKLALVSRR